MRYKANLSLLSELSTSKGPYRVCIRNMVFEDYMEDEDELQEILQDTRDLLRPFGAVSAVEIQHMSRVKGLRSATNVGSSGVDSNELVVLAVMDSYSAAASVVALLSGTVIGGNAISVSLQESDPPGEPSEEMSGRNGSGRFDLSDSFALKPHTKRKSDNDNDKWVVKIVYKSDSSRCERSSELYYYFLCNLSPHELTISLSHLLIDSLTCHSNLPVVEAMASHCGFAPVNIWSEQIPSSVSSSLSLLPGNSVEHEGRIPSTQTQLPWGIAQFSYLNSALQAAQILSKLVVAGQILSVFMLDMNYAVDRHPEMHTQDYSELLPINDGY